eukprot:6201833-Pleurochrysis_carterae.AAC.1
MDDFLPVAGEECSAGDLRSAAKVWLAVVEFNELLHTPVGDTSITARAQMGAACQAKGVAWVVALRAHSGNSVAFNYMHLSAAHLGELIVRHGMLERGDDEILERDNRTAKRVKSNLLFWGGTSNPERRTEVRAEFKEVQDAGGEVVDFEQLESQRRRTCGQGEQFARLMLGRKVLLVKRLQRRPTESAVKADLVKYTKEQTQSARLDVRKHLSALEAA